MNPNSLMLSFLFGTIGLGFFQYGRKAGRVVPLGAGLGLIILPYFITNLIAMSLVCAALMAMPWVLRHA
ncbi:MAG TPA: hypothetical protein VH475_22115 [Tepidisphaeraceae bacterium]|jgi:hypothetical protein